MKPREKERGRAGRGRGRKESYMCMEEHGFRNSLYVHRGRPCPFLRLVFCQECVASGYAVYMTLNTLPLFALRITSLYLFSLYLDEARYHRSTPDMEILREKRYVFYIYIYFLYVCVSALCLCISVRKFSFLSNLNLRITKTLNVNRISNIIENNIFILEEYK